MTTSYFFSRNLLRYGFVVAFAASLSFNTQAQTAPAIQWDKTIGGSENDVASCLYQTFDGGFIVGGYSDSPIYGDKSANSRGGYDYWLVKIDANGNKIWDRTFGGNNSDELQRLQQTLDGGFILGGSTLSGLSGDKSQTSRGNYDFWVVKLDASGNKIWDKTFGGSSTDFLNSIQQTKDGGYILGGTSKSNATGDKSQNSKGDNDYWVIKLDITGNKIWDKTIGGNEWDDLTALQQTSDGGFILGGFSRSGISADKSQASLGDFDYWIVKLDANGNKLWDKTYGGTGTDYLRSLQQTSDGGFILGGSSISERNGDKSESGRGFHDYWVIKVDSGGNKLWDKTFGGNSTDFLYSPVQQTSDGGYILSGSSSSGISGDKSQPSHGSNDYWVVKLNANGNKIWDKTIGGSSNDILRKMNQTFDGGFILAGFSNSNIGGEKTQLCKGLHDYWIVKLAPEITGVKESEATFNLSISPNPNQGKFELNLSNITTSTAEITITDLLGRKVLQQQLPVTDQRVTEELEIKAAKGMYLLQVKAGEQIISNKIVVE